MLTLTLLSSYSDMTTGVVLTHFHITLETNQPYPFINSNTSSFLFYFAIVI